MRTAVLPDALLAAALGLTLSYAAPSAARQSVVLAGATAIAAALFPLAGVSEDLAFTACWISLLVTAAIIHLPNGPGPWLARALGLNAGLWSGLVTHVQGGVLSVIIALPLLLLCIPGRMIVARKWGIGLKVASSWLIAVAALEIGLNLVPTPGYKPDHMD